MDAGTFKIKVKFIECECSRSWFTILELYDLIGYGEMKYFDALLLLSENDIGEEVLSNILME